MDIGVLVLIISFVFLLIIGVPIAFSIGISGILTMLISIDFLPALTTFAYRMATSLDSFSLLAIPFFILAGNIMNSGGIAIRLINFAKVLVGPIPGGLSFVNIVANMLFGAISGSAVASASAIGSIMAPEMQKEKYDKNYSTAINVASATTGLSIPPSNILIVYSLASGGASISALFMAGYIPGILTGLSILLVGIIYAYKHKYPTIKVVKFSEGIMKFLDAIPSLMLLVIVIGGIIAGFFTATEASAIAVLYALILAFLYKAIKIKDLPSILLNSVKTTSIVMLLIGGSMGLSWIMAYENMPQNVSSSLLTISENKVVVLLIINFILLAVGVFMDMTPAVLVFTPIFLPVVKALGVDTVHFGIIMVLNLSIGLCTPPVGSVLFVGCSVTKTKIEDVAKPLMYMFVSMVFVLLLVTYLEPLSLWLPKVLGLID